MNSIKNTLLLARVFEACSNDRVESRAKCHSNGRNFRFTLHKWGPRKMEWKIQTLIIVLAYFWSENQKYTLISFNQKIILRTEFRTWFATTLVYQTLMWNPLRTRAHMCHLEKSRDTSMCTDTPSFVVNSNKATATTRNKCAASLFCSVCNKMGKS